MANGRQYHMNTNSRQHWMDDVIRRVAAEQQRNPEVLSSDYRDPRFANRPMQPAPAPQEPYMGWLGDVVGAVKDFRLPEGPSIPGARTPLNPSGTLGGGVNMLKDMLISTGEDFGAEGGHKDTPIPMGKLAMAGLFPLRGISKVAKSLIGGVDEAATVKVKPSTAPKDLTEVEFKKMQNIDTELLEEDLNFERIAELVGWKGKVNTATHLDILKIANKELDELMDIRRKFVDKTKDPRNPLDLELPDDSSLDFTGVKGAKAQGQCYPYCYRKAFEKDETIKIVHGQVDNGLGELTPHAWIETKDGLVLDWQTMEGPKEILEQLSSMGSPVITSRLKHYGKGIPVKEFDKFFKPVRDLEFTPEEMRKLTSGTRSPGPFTSEEISQILPPAPKDDLDDLLG